MARVQYIKSDNLRAVAKQCYKMPCLELFMSTNDSLFDHFLT